MTFLFKHRMIKLSKIKPNPNNPRLIKDDKFKKLCENIKSLPKMMAMRPIVVDKSFTIMGGNMRLKALQELGYKEIPDEWLKKASDYTEEELKQFIVLDNVSFGEWDWDMLANEWDEDALETWGVDIPNFKAPEEVESSGYDQELQWYLNIKCNNEKECQALYEKFIKQGLDVKIVT